MSTPVGAVFPILSLPELGVLQQPIGDRDAGDRFGEAVAVAGVRVIVGAPGDDEAGLDAGAAYAFVRRDDRWVLEAKLMPAELRPGDAFGTSVALHVDGVGDVKVAVGAPGDDRDLDGLGNLEGTYVDRGAAYLYQRSGQQWALYGRREPAGDHDGPGDRFGASVALSDTALLVGAPYTDMLSGGYGLATDAGAIYYFAGFGAQSTMTGAAESGYAGPRYTRDGHFGTTVGFGGFIDQPSIRGADATGVWVFGWVGAGWVLRAVYRDVTYQPSSTVGAGFAVSAYGRLQNTSRGMRIVWDPFIGGASHDVRAVTADGVVTVESLLPSSSNGYPVFSDGRLAFRYSGKQVYRVAPDGTEEFLAGDPSESFEDGVGINAGFVNMYSPEADETGGMFVADANTLRHVAADGTVTTLAGLQFVSGIADGTGSAARLTYPHHLTWHPPTSTLYFTDNGALRALLPGRQVVTLAGKVGEPGHVDGFLPTSRLDPVALAVHSDGSVIIAEGGSLRRYASGSVTTLVPPSTGEARIVDGSYAEARFGGVRSVAFDQHGLLFVNDAGVIRIMASGSLYTIAGLPTPNVGSGFRAHVYADSTLFVGTTHTAPPTTPSDNTAGVVWAFTAPASSSAYPIFPDGNRDATMNFGSTLAVGDGVLFVGSVRENHTGPAVPIQGFVRLDDGRWRLGFSLTPSSVAAGPDFGWALDATDDLVVVSSPVAAGEAGGYVVVFDLAARDVDGDGLPDRWETTYGLDPLSSLGVNGADGDKDGDGISNLDEFEAQTHPAANATHTRYLAEGATTWTFSTLISVANPGQADATVNLRFLRADGVVRSHQVSVPSMTSQHVLVETLPDMDGTEFSTMIESDALVAVDRVMWWPRAVGTQMYNAYGSHAERAVVAPATEWYFAEGATHSGFNLFYLLQNPSTGPVDVDVRYLRPAGAPLVKRYTLAPLSRTNIWVDVETFDTPNGPATLLDNTDVAAVFEVVGTTGIIVERALYRDSVSRPFEAGHESAGVTAPASDWFLAEGATGEMFDTFVLVANPGNTEATVRVTFLVDDGRTFTKDFTIGPNARTNIWVDLESFDGGMTFPLADAAFSTTLHSMNNVPIIVERSLWWPGPTSDTWVEAHNSFGATETGTKWVAAYSQVQTYFLIANVGDTEATIRVTPLPTVGPTASQTITIGPRTRFNVVTSPSSPLGAIFESIGTSPAPIVVERATYSTETGTSIWGAGTASLLTKVQ